MSQFDSLIIGEVAQDTNVDYDGTTVHAVGGAVYYSGFAAANIGHKTAVLPKADTTQVDLAAAFAPAPNVTVYPLHSKASFVTKNVYHTPDRERRTSTVDSVIEPYRPEEVPEIDAAIWHLAGLVGGDIPNEMIPMPPSTPWWPLMCRPCCAGWRTAAWSTTTGRKNGRCSPTSASSRPTPPAAEILTGLTDRAEAAKLLYRPGAPKRS